MLGSLRASARSIYDRVQVIVTKCGEVTLVFIHTRIFVSILFVAILSLVVSTILPAKQADAVRVSNTNCDSTNVVVKPAPNTPSICADALQSMPSMAAANGQTASDPTFGGAPGALPFIPVCSGSGVDGPRVQAMYAYDESTGNKLSEVADNIRTVMQESDRIVYLSALKQGGSRRIRLATETYGSSCRPSIIAIPIAHGVFISKNFLSGDLPAVGDALKAAGVPSTSSQGLIATVFIDNRDLNSAAICGVANVIMDDKVNGFNAIPSLRINQIFSKCWTPFVAVHEIVHNMGAVQNSAPHTTGHGHCTDGIDIMCYADGATKDTQPIVCQATEYRTTGLLDCNNDDYFSVKPPVGSYLATHFNVANSPFLTSTDVSNTQAPTLSVSTVGSDLTVLPYVGVPFTAKATTTGGLLYVSKNGLQLSNNDCNIELSNPITPGSTSSTISGVAACSVSEDSGVNIAIADNMGRDAEQPIHFSVAKPKQVLDTKTATSVTRNIDGSYTLAVNIKGRVPNNNTAQTPLVHVYLFAKYKSRFVNGSTRVYTDGSGTGKFTFPSSMSGHRLVIGNIANSGTWRIPTTQVTLKAKA